MPRFAVLNNNSVTNLIVADDIETAETVTNQTCVQYDPSLLVAVGWTYDGTNFTDPNEVNNA